MAIYSDIDIELEDQADGDILRDTETEAVRNAIINIINNTIFIYPLTTYLLYLIFN